MSELDSHLVCIFFAGDQSATASLAGRLSRSFRNLLFIDMSGPLQPHIHLQTITAG